MTCTGYGIDADYEGRAVAHVSELHAVAASLEARRRTQMAGEMGTGKTFMAAAAEMNAFRRVRIICPTHLLGEWKREVERILPLVFSPRRDRQDSHGHRARRRGVGGAWGALLDHEQGDDEERIRSNPVGQALASLRRMLGRHGRLAGGSVPHTEILVEGVLCPSCLAPLKQKMDGLSHLWGVRRARRMV